MHADRVARTGAMAGALAHELNQPISAILSNAQAALRQLQNAGATTPNVRAAREALEAIERDDRRASETIAVPRPASAPYLKASLSDWPALSP